jgi:hypothetical protein
VGLMRTCNQLLSPMGKGSKNVATRSKLLPLESGIDSFHSKAVYCMLLEVRSGGLVLFVLKMLNTPCLALALLGGASEKMAYTAVVLLNDDIWFEK